MGLSVFKFFVYANFCVHNGTRIGGLLQRCKYPSGDLGNWTNTTLLALTLSVIFTSPFPLFHPSYWKYYESAARKRGNMFLHSWWTSSLYQYFCAFSFLFGEHIQLPLINFSNSFKTFVHTYFQQLAWKVWFIKPQITNRRLIFCFLHFSLNGLWQMPSIMHQPDLLARLS